MNDFKKKKSPTHFTDSRYAHIICSGVAWCSIFSNVKCMNQRVIDIWAVKFAGFVSVKVWQPRIMSPPNKLLVFFRTLLCSICWIRIRTWVDATCFVSPSFPRAKRSTVNWCRMITFSCLHGNASATWPRARSPVRPISPAAINWQWKVFDVDTFLILTPLDKKISVKHFLKVLKLTLWWPQLVPGAAGRNSVVQVPLSAHHSCEHISLSCEQTVVSSVALNCSLHWRSALYIAPAGSSGYWYSSKSVGASSRHFPRPWLGYENKKLFTLLHKRSLLTYSKKCVMSRRLQLDHETVTVSASKLGVMICRIGPLRWSHPVLAVSWYMPKLLGKRNIELSETALPFRIINICITFLFLCFLIESIFKKFVQYPAQKKSAISILLIEKHVWSLRDRLSKLRQTFWSFGLRNPLEF